MPRSHKQWRELPTFTILFFAQTARACATLAYLSRHRRRVLAKSAPSGEPVFTSMDVLLYGP
jgi:hypothetical protein